jgi:hypothetical protein
MVDDGRATVGGLGVEVIPDLLIEIELWGIGREAIHLEPRMASEKIPHGGAAMDRASVPEQDNGSVQVPQESRKKQATSRWVMFRDGSGSRARGGGDAG